MQLTYNDLFDQKVLTTEIKRYQSLFPETIEITPETITIAVDNWIPLADYIKNQVSQASMAKFRLTQRDAVKSWCDAHQVAIRTRNRNISHALQAYRETMYKAWEELMQRNNKYEEVK
jgi:hypothetical protein